MDDAKNIYSNIEEAKTPLLNFYPMNNLMNDNQIARDLTLKDFNELLKNNKWNRQKMFMDLVKYERLDIVKFFINKNIPNTETLNRSMLYACKNNKILLLQILLKYSKADPGFDNNKCIILACKKIYPDILETLLKDKRADPTSNKNECIKIACSNLCYDDIRIASPDISEQIRFYMDFYRMDYETAEESYYDDGGCIGCRYCCTYSKDEEEEEIIHSKNMQKILKLLLNDGRADPTIDDNACIQKLMKNNYINMIGYLVDDGRANFMINAKYFKSVLDCGYDTELLYILFDKNIITTYSPFCTYKNHHWWKTHTMTLVRKQIERTQYKEGHFILKHKNGYKLIPDNKTITSVKYNHVFISACKYGKSHVVKMLLKDKNINPAYQDNEAFIIACKYGRYKIVKMLLRDNRIDPTARNNTAFLSICKIGLFKQSAIRVGKLLIYDLRILTKDTYYIALDYAKKNKDDLLREMLLQ